MKKTAISILVFICFVSVSSAFDESELNLITVVNKTGKDIYYLFISPADSSEWGPEVLNTDRVISDNSLLSFYIYYPEDCNDFDIYAIDEEDQSYAFWDYSICDDAESTITISENDLSEDDAGMSFITVNLYNTLKTSVYYLFLSPSDSSMWGVDLLDEETILEPEDSHNILVPASEEEVQYDFMCLDENGDMYQFNLTLSEDSGEIDVKIEPSDLVEEE